MIRICDECGCGHKGGQKEIIIERSVTEKNDRIAHRTWHRLSDMDIFCINLMGAPGSGKTTLIEGLAGYIGTDRLAVIQGDLESDVDKKRLEKLGIETFQINTHSGCHLTAAMIEDALENMKLPEGGYLIIENVGNLVCPAGVSLGQHLDIVVSSTAEGADKPEKYPLIFHHAGAVVISKYDIADAVDFNEKMYINGIRKINTDLKIFRTSASEKSSFEPVAGFLENEKKNKSQKTHKH